MSERLPIFPEDDDLGTSDFAPTRAHRPDADQTRQIAEKLSFRDREGAKPAPAPQAGPASAAPAKVEQRRHRTGRNIQLSLKVTPDVQQRFYALADDNGWILGEAFAQAVLALEEKIGKSK